MACQENAEYARSDDPAGQKAAASCRKLLYIETGYVAPGNPERIGDLGTPLQLRNDARNGNHKQQHIRLDRQDASIDARPRHARSGSLSHLALGSQVGPDLLAERGVAVECMKSGARLRADEDRQGGRGDECAETGGANAGFPEHELQDIMIFRSGDTESMNRSLPQGAKQPMSKRPALSMPAALLAAAATVFTAALASAPAHAQDTPDFRAEFKGQFEVSARKLVALSEAMPAESYAWSPMEGVMTVSRVYRHIARYNYMYPHLNLGIEPPKGVDYQTLEEGGTDKDEVVGLLAASMDHVRAVVDGMSEADLDAPVELYGRQVASWAVLLQLITHMNEHLGQSIAYARMNRVVPPWSR